MAAPIIVDVISLAGSCVSMRLRFASLDPGEFGWNCAVWWENVAEISAPFEVEVRKNFYRGLSAGLHHGVAEKRRHTEGPPSAGRWPAQWWRGATPRKARLGRPELLANSPHSVGECERAANKFRRAPCVSAPPVSVMKNSAAPRISAVVKDS